MGLSRILKSFSTISFAWFCLFIMLENTEAKIGEHITAPRTRSTERGAIKLSCVFDYHNYDYLHNVAEWKLQRNRSMTNGEFLITPDGSRGRWCGWH